MVMLPLNYIIYKCLCLFMVFHTMVSKFDLFVNILSKHYNCLSVIHDILENNVT